MRDILSRVLILKPFHSGIVFKEIKAKLFIVHETNLAKLSSRIILLKCKFHRPIPFYLGKHRHVTTSVITDVESYVCLSRLTDHNLNAWIHCRILCQRESLSEEKEKERERGFPLFARPGRQNLFSSFSRSPLGFRCSHTSHTCL